ncbi:LegC family aminotransferase [Persephonella sp.]
MSKLIYLDAPVLGELEKKYLCEAIDTGYVSSVGRFVEDFEKRFSDYLGVKKSVSVQSGTAALHISLYELGIKEGDEVIVPALTFVATANPVVYLKGKPVFVDIDPDTWNIDVNRIEEKITEKTKAIIPVHLYGNPTDMNRINNIAKKYNLYVIEDATESLGAKYRGRYTGTIGDLGCFSFNGNKLITTGGGGMVVGNSEDRLDHIKYLVNQARDNRPEYYHSEIGFNYRMTNIEAALGIAQMERIESFLEKKKIFNQIYREELKGLVRFQKEYDNAESSWWLTAVYIDRDIDIPELQKELSKRGIQTRRIFTPLVEFPMYRESRDKYPVSYRIFSNGLCLPSSPLNSEDDIFYVTKTLKEILG